MERKQKVVSNPGQLAFVFGSVKSGFLEAEVKRTWRESENIFIDFIFFFFCLNKSSGMVLLVDIDSFQGLFVPFFDFVFAVLQNEEEARHSIPCRKFPLFLSFCLFVCLMCFRISLLVLVALLHVVDGGDYNFFFLFLFVRRILSICNSVFVFIWLGF